MVNEKPRETGMGGLYFANSVSHQSVSQSLGATSLSRFSSPQESGSVCFPIALFRLPPLGTPTLLRRKRVQIGKSAICNLRWDERVQVWTRRRGGVPQPLICVFLVLLAPAPSLRRIRDYQDQDQETSRKQESAEEGRRAGGSNPPESQTAPPQSPLNNLSR